MRNSFKLLFSPNKLSSLPTDFSKIFPRIFPLHGGERYLKRNYFSIIHFDFFASFGAVINFLGEVLTDFNKNYAGISTIRKVFSKKHLFSFFQWARKKFKANCKNLWLIFHENFFSILYDRCEILFRRVGWRIFRANFPLFIIILEFYLKEIIEFVWTFGWGFLFIVFG